MAKLNYLPALDDVNTPLSEQQLAILERQVESEKPEPSVQSQFNYAWGLLKSDDEDDNKQGINILTDIFKNIPARRRECLYYLTIGCFKIGEYEDAKRYVEALLIHEPDNHQAIQLKMAIENKISKDGLIGVAIVSGFIAAGAAALGIFLKQQQRKH